MSSSFEVARDNFTLTLKLCSFASDAAVCGSRVAQLLVSELILPSLITILPRVFGLRSSTCRWITLEVNKTTRVYNGHHIMHFVGGQGNSTATYYRSSSRGPPQTPRDSVFDSGRRQRTTPLGNKNAPSSWSRRPPPSRRKSDAGHNRALSDSEVRPICLSHHPYHGRVA